MFRRRKFFKPKEKGEKRRNQKIEENERSIDGDLEQQFSDSLEIERR